VLRDATLTLNGTHLSALEVHNVRKTNQVASSPRKVPAAKIQKPTFNPHSTPMRIPMTSCPRFAKADEIFVVWSK